MKEKDYHIEYLQNAFDEILDHAIISNDPYTWENESYGLLAYIRNRSYRVPSCNWYDTNLLSRLDTCCLFVDFENTEIDYGVNRSFIPSIPTSNRYIGFRILDSSFLYPSKVYFGTNDFVMLKGTNDVYATVNGKMIDNPSKYFSNKIGHHYFVGFHYPVKNNRFGKVHENYNLIEIESFNSDFNNRIKNEILDLQRQVLKLIIQNPTLIFSPNYYSSWDDETIKEEMKTIKEVFDKQSKKSYETRLREVEHSIETHRN